MNEIERIELQHKDKEASELDGHKALARTNFEQQWEGKPFDPTDVPEENRTKGKKRNQRLGSPVQKKKKQKRCRY